MNEHFITEETIQHNRAALVSQRGATGRHRVAAKSSFDFVGAIVYVVIGVVGTLVVWGFVDAYNTVHTALQPPAHSSTGTAPYWDSKALGGLPLTQNDTSSSDPTRESTQPPTVTTEVFVVCRLLPDSTTSAKTITVLTPNRYLTSEESYDLEQDHTYRADVMDDTYLASTPQDLGPSSDSERAECSIWR